MIRALLGLLLWSQLAFAEVPVPPLTAPVVDLTETLDSAQKDALQSKLLAFQNRKGSQIGVLILPSTAPETIEQFGIRVADSWKLGRKGVDDGAILIIARDDHALRIEVGYGLEGALNDAVSKRIVSDIVAPFFKSGDFYRGIDSGVDAMIKVIDGEPLPAPEKKRSRASGDDGWFPIAFVAVVVIGGILRAMLGRFPGSLAIGGLVTLGMWIFVGMLLQALMFGFAAFLFTLVSGGARGFSGGFGGGGSGGGGGFSGGGGGFGGGGASGRW